MTVLTGVTASVLLRFAPILFSALALGLSLVTAWLTLFRKGEVRMTHPLTIYFGRDSGGEFDQKPKLGFRALLYCTSKRGRAVDGIFARLTTVAGTEKDFFIWLTGEDRPHRGSGISVSEAGLVTDHHFLLSPDDDLRFEEGQYILKVFAYTVRERKPIKLFSQTLRFTQADASVLMDSRGRVDLHWAPEVGRFAAHRSLRSQDETRQELM